MACAAQKAYARQPAQIDIVGASVALPRLVDGY
jgi:hypothetical protein